MADVRPFAAVMPPAARAARVAAPPYDVVSEAEARRMVAADPLGFLRVGRAEADLPPGIDPYSEAVYRKAAENYRTLCREVPLKPDTAPALYVYSQTLGRHRQTGIVACASVDEYDADVIRRHEKTRQDKEDDRTRHIMTLGSQTGPVFLIYRDNAAVDTLVSETVSKQATLFDFEVADGVRHSVWRVPPASTESLRQAFREVAHLYIADGHHRAASASRARSALRAANPAHSGQEEYNGFLAVLFPASQVRILPYNRIVNDLGGKSAAELRTAIERTPFRLDAAPAPTPACPGTVHMYCEGTWWRLTYGGDTASLSPVARLDVSLLQDHVLGPLLGIDDPRTSRRIDFVGGIRGTRELEQRVVSGAAAVAFSMVPTTVEQLMAISDAGQIMPPKSTWFEPKLRDGLFVHDIC
ncbi:MAG: DUF1015 domain-containing protein [Lentisphaeria bacterium]|nr:DUF1015 domain-containing protein [Lentisphaeria bacterium]